MIEMDQRVMDRIDLEKVGAQVDGRDEMLRRSAWLAEKDRRIVQLSAKGNLTMREMSELVGLPAGSISRRLTRIRLRMADRVVNGLLDRRCALPVEFKEIGLEYFLTGLRTGEIADKHRLPAGQVRRIIQFIQGWQKGRVGNI
jgi:DNA-directed RNA polymerase specialized sigma24 family protein